MSAERQEINRRNAVELVRRKLAPYVPADRLQEAAEALGAMWGEQCLMAEARGRREAAERCVEFIRPMWSEAAEDVRKYQRPETYLRGHAIGQNQLCTELHALIVNEFGLEVW